MQPLDLVVIALYAALMLVIGVRARASDGTPAGYFLGSRTLPGWTVMLSIVATETSALTVISIPGVGARGDLSFLQLAFGYLIGRIVVAWWLLPGYFAGSQDTAYTRLERRFGAGTRRLVAGTFLVTRFLGDGVRLFAGAIPLALVTGWSLPVAIIVMGLGTLLYTWFGGLRAVVWADVVQLAVYGAGALIALGIAWDLAGGPAAVFRAAHAAGKLRVLVPSWSLAVPYTLAGGLLGGAMLSAASHGTDHLIVQRLLATRSLAGARRALIGSGVLVIMQFLLFLVLGIALWAGGQAPADTPPDRLFPHFIVSHLPAGVRGLLVAGLLAAAMSTLSSSINALASSVTYDWYATWGGGRRTPDDLLRVGRGVSVAWGIALVVAALGFVPSATRETPAVVLALSIASVTYGALLGTFLLAGRTTGITGRDVALATFASTSIMLVIIFARPLTDAGLSWLAPLGRLAWPWYVPLGTVLTLVVAMGSHTLFRRSSL